jgi:hypothetical protein
LEENSTSSGRKKAIAVPLAPAGAGMVKMLPKRTVPFSTGSSRALRLPTKLALKRVAGVS